MAFHASIKCEASPLMSQIFVLMGKAWDIDAAMELLEKKPREPKMVDISTAMALIRTDPEHVKAINLETAAPIIIGTIVADKEKYWLPLDGWHRIRKAQSLGVDKLPAYILTKKEIDQIQLKDRCFYR